MATTPANALRYRVQLLCVWLVAICLLPLHARSTETEPGNSNDLFHFQCGPPRQPGPGLIPIDYRERTISEKIAGGVAQLDQFHTDPAYKEMSNPRPYAPNVGGNFDFSLRHCPNHHRALRGLIDWDLRGGKFVGIPPTECYLQWALRFAPDDATVLAYGGSYFLRKGDLARSRAWYEKSLEIDPGAPETNYNFGLLLFEMKDFESARRQARIAYGAGYPLPGLKNKLERAGYTLHEPGSTGAAPRE